jgi:hypothetical protein
MPLFCGLQRICAAGAAIVYVAMIERNKLGPTTMQEAAAAREKRLLGLEAMTTRLFENNPHPPIVLGCTLPRPPGMLHCKAGLDEPAAQGSATGDGTSRASAAGLPKTSTCRGTAGKDVYVLSTMHATTGASPRQVCYGLSVPAVIPIRTPYPLRASCLHHSRHLPAVAAQSCCAHSCCMVPAGS